MQLNKFYADVCKSTSIPPVGIMELSSMCRVLDDQVKLCFQDHVNLNNYMIIPEYYLYSST